MKKKNAKLIAPVVIIALLTAYLIGFAFFWSSVPAPVIFKVIGVVVPLALIGVGVFVLAERIKEIRSGEEDDLSKY